MDEFYRMLKRIPWQFNSSLFYHVEKSRSSSKISLESVSRTPHAAG